MIFFMKTCAKGARATWVVPACLAALVFLTLGDGVSSAQAAPAKGAQVQENGEVRLSNAMASFKKSPIFQVLYKLDPQKEAEVRAGLKTILTDLDQNRISKQQADQRIFDLGLTLTKTAVIAYAPRISDEALIRHVAQSRDALIQFRDQPDLCLAIAEGTQAPFSPAFLDAQERAKADLLESALSNPVGKTPLTESRAMDFLKKASREMGYSKSDFAALESPVKVTAAEKCTAYIKSFDLILSLPPTDGADVMRFLWARSVR